VSDRRQPPIRVALLGSTGSIGRQALDVLTSVKSRFTVVAMAAGSDTTTFEKQLAEVAPRVAAMANETAAASMEVPGGTRLERGSDVLERFATREDVDMVVVATGGIVSLRPVLAALAAGKVVATANKETLVAGGHLVMPLARALATRTPSAGATARPPGGTAEVSGVFPGRGAITEAWASPLAWLRPIDSEHSAIWQCLAGEPFSGVARLILTASGGPFRTWPAARIAAATPRDALAHPNWSMGSKITVDSASLMNKGLEVIEAHWLYDVHYSRIDVLIHPQSLIHSLVEFVDGSLKAQLGLPDMRIPIQYAVTYPRRVAGPGPHLDLLEHPELTFEAPDPVRFPALRVCRDAALRGPRATAALITADEVAVRRFLDGSLAFMDIPALAAGAVERYGSGADPDLPELIALDAEVRSWASGAVITEALR
jgi:1-deoxy-D-xylulose-5-phosphate reductoisomerase